MDKHVIRISEMEAANNFPSVLAKVRAGTEVIIESDAKPVAVVSPVAERPARLLTESIAMAERRGCTATLDGDFAHDLGEVIASHREPLNPPAWD